METYAKNCGKIVSYGCYRFLHDRSGRNDGEEIEISSQQVMAERFPEKIKDDVDSENDSVNDDEAKMEANFCNVTIEKGKIFNQKCVECLQKDSAIAFIQSKHQSFCEN